MYETLWASFLMAFGLSMILTPVAIKIAVKIGAMDVPKDSRRMHTKPIPRFGGFAIFIGNTVSMACFLYWEPRILWILLGGAMIYILGVVDDLKDLPAKVKFSGQLLVAVIIYMAGIRIEFLTNFFGQGKSQLGEVLCFIITVIWIVGATNAINIIDGLDGLAAGTVAISSLCVAYVAYIFGRYMVAAAMLSLAGATLGFLPFNFYPARIIMGDGGSQYLGFMMAALSILGSVKSATVVAVVIPIMVLGLPIFDTIFAILRRIINRKPIMQADKGHLHHRLMGLGYGQRRATLMLYGVTAIMGIAAVTYSRDFIVETLGLLGIAFMYIYVFLTDANHVIPEIRENCNADLESSFEYEQEDKENSADEEKSIPGKENSQKVSKQTDNIKK